MDRVIRKHSESFRREVVREIESGRASIAETSKEYGVGKSSIKLWLSEYGRFRPKRSIMEVVMKSEKEKIAELEKALAEAHLKLRVYDEMLNQASKLCKMDLKKKFGSAQSGSLSEKGMKSKHVVKR